MGASHIVPGEVIDPDERRAGFTSLYDDHITEVYEYIYRRCRDRAISEDVTQDVFLSAVRTVHDPRTISIGWLMRTARNRLIDVMRRVNTESRKLRLLQGRPEEQALDGVAVDRVAIERAMASLSVDHRLVLTLHYLDGYSVPALADELGRTVKSVEGLVSRASRQLRSELGSADA